MVIPAEDIYHGVAYL